MITFGTVMFYFIISAEGSCTFATLVVLVNFAFDDHCIVTWLKFIVFLYLSTVA